MYNIFMKRCLKISLSGKMIDVTVIYRNNKNLYLRIQEDGSLQVSCHPNVSDAYIISFLKQKEEWISKHLEQAKHREMNYLTGEDGKQVRILGETYSVEYRQAKQEKIVYEDGKWIYYLKECTSARARQLFYKQGNLFLKENIEQLRKEWDRKICIANQKGLPSITIRYMTSRWGSCTPAKSHITISSRLIHFPLSCLEYVLLHEYTHLLVANHSSDFYAIVQRYMPNWKQYRKQLK